MKFLFSMLSKLVGRMKGWPSSENVVDMQRCKDMGKPLEISVMPPAEPRIASNIVYIDTALADENISYTHTADIMDMFLRTELVYIEGTVGDHSGLPMSLERVSHQTGSATIFRLDDGLEKKVGTTIKTVKDKDLLLLTVASNSGSRFHHSHVGSFIAECFKYCGVVEGKSDLISWKNSFQARMHGIGRKEEMHEATVYLQFLNNWFAKNKDVISLTLQRLNFLERNSEESPFRNISWSIEDMVDTASVSLVVNLQSSAIAASILKVNARDCINCTQTSKSEDGNEYQAVITGRAGMEKFLSVTSGMVRNIKIRQLDAEAGESRTSNTKLFR